MSPKASDLLLRRQVGEQNCSGVGASQAEAECRSLHLLLYGVGDISLAVQARSGSVVCGLRSPKLFSCCIRFERHDDIVQASFRNTYLDEIVDMMRIGVREDREQTVIDRSSFWQPSTSSSAVVQPIV